MKRILIWILLPVLMIGMSPILAGGHGEKAPFNLGDVLPADTLLYMGMDLSKSIEAVKASNLGQMMQDPDFQVFLEPLMAKARPQMAELEKQVQIAVGISMQEILASQAGPLDIAILDFDMRQQRPTIAIAANLGSLSVRLLAMAQGAGLLTDAPDYAGYKNYQVQGTPEPLFITVLGTTALITNEAEVNQKLVDNYQGKGSGLLAQDEDFVRAYAQYLDGGKEDAVLFGLYANLKAAMNKVQPMLPPMVTQMMEQTGVSKIQDVLLLSTVQGNHGYSRLMVRMPKDAPGAPAIFHSKPIDIGKYAREFPTSVSQFNASSLDLAGFINSIEEILNLADPEQAMGLMPQYEQGLQMFEMMTGLSLKEDLAKAFAGEMASAAFSVDSGILPEQVIILPVQDQAKVQKILQTITRALELDTKTVTFHGQEISYFSKPLGQLGSNPFEKLDRVRDPMQGIVLALSSGLSGTAYCYKDGNFYYSHSVQCLKYYLDWKNDPSVPALSGNKSFLEVMSEQSKNCASFTYIDQRKLIEQLYSTLIFTLRTFEGYIRDGGVPLEAALLPRAKTIVKYLDPAYLAIDSEKDAVVITFRNNVNILVPASLAAIISAIAIPAYMENQAKSRLYKCMAHLNQMGKNLAYWRMDYGRLKYGPPAHKVKYITALYKSKLLTEIQLFSSPGPGSRGSISDYELRNDIGKALDYEATEITPWLGVDQSTFPVIWSKPGVHHNKQTILYLDGHVDWMTGYNPVEWQLERVRQEAEEHKEEIEKNRQKTIELYEKTLGEKFDK